MASYDIKSGQTSTGIILYDGQMRIQSGGTANNTLVSGYRENAGVYISSGGVANSTVMMTRRASTFVSYGGVANDTVVYEDTYLDVFGGTANNTIVKGYSQPYPYDKIRYGYFRVSSGGTANNTTLSLGSMDVGRDGTANSTTINSGGTLHIFSGATINNTIINSDGIFSAVRGALVNNTVVNSGGTFAVLNSAQTTGVTINSGGIMDISYNGLADGVTVSSGGSMTVDNYGTATNIEAASGAYLGFVLNPKTFLTGTSGGVLLEIKDGTLSDYVIDNGHLEVQNGCAAQNITVNPGGKLTVFSGGTASITENGGYVGIEMNTTIEEEEEEEEGMIGNETTVSFQSNTFSGLTLSRTSATVHSGTTANDITLTDYAYLHVFSGGIVDQAAINSRGDLHVFSSGLANAPVVNSGGSLHVSSGGIAADIVENGGFVSIEDEANAIFAVHMFSGLTLSDASATVHSGTTANDTGIGSNGELHVFSDGKADNTTVFFNGDLFVLSGGSAFGNMVQSGGRLEVESGGAADDIAVHSGGSLLIFSGGTATGISIAAGAYLGLDVAADTVIAGTSGGWEFTTLDGHFLNYVIDTGYLNVFGGGIADMTTVNGGSLNVSTGGTAINTTVASGGFLLVQAGGTADHPTVNHGGYLHVESDGTAGNIVENGGFISVDDGANVTYASNVISGLVLSYTSATVHSGTTVNDATVKSEGILLVFSGGTTNDALIVSDGNLIVSSGGTANDTVVDMDGYLHVSSNGTANRTTIHYAGYEYVSSGGTANDTIVESGGGLHVSSGGFADRTMVNSGGYLQVFSDGTADNTTVCSSGWFFISSGGTGNATTVNPGGFLILSTGAIATELMENGGYVDIASDTIVTFAPNTVSQLVLSSGASATVHSGTTVNSATVDSNGHLYVFSGGTATGIAASSGAYLGFDIAQNTCITGTLDGLAFEIAEGKALNYLLESGYLNVFDGGVANNVTVNGGSFSIYQGGTANHLVMNGGSLSIFSSGIVNSAAISSHAYLYVSSGGMANSTEVNSGGNLHVSAFGTATETEVDSGGNLYVSAFGSANDVKVNSAGHVYVSSGGTATEVVENGGYVEAADGADVMFVANTISDLVLSNASATIHSGTTATAITIKEGGNLQIYSGGEVNNTEIQSTGWNGGLFVLAFGTANGIVVNSGGDLYVSSGGTANDIKVNSAGYFYVSSGGTATEVVENGGYVEVANGAEVMFVANTFSDLDLKFEVTVHSGTTATNTTINGGRLQVFSAGMADNVMVNSGGNLTISSGGRATAVIENGGYVNVADGADVTFASHTLSRQYLSGAVTVHSGTTACDIALQDYCYLYLYDGGKLTGRVICPDYYAVISASEGAIIDFDLTRTRPGAGARITNLSWLQGTPSYTITVGEDQAEGIYVLVDWVADFDQPITIVNTDGLELGMLSVDETVTVYGAAYTLKLQDFSLSLSIGENNTPSPYTSDGWIVSNGISSIKSGEAFFDTTVLPYGKLVISSGGTATNTSVCSGGNLTILPGATATDIVALSGAWLSFNMAQDTLIAGTSGGSAFAFKDGSVSDYVQKDFDITICSGGTADNVAIQERGSMTVASDGNAANMTICSGGSLTVSSGGTVDQAVVSGGKLTVFSGGTAMNVLEAGGSVYVADGAMVIFTANTLSGLVVSNTNATVHSATIAAGTTILDGGVLEVYSGGEANDTTISSAGRLWVSSGGTANRTTVNSAGSFDVLPYGTANGVTVNDNGYLYVCFDGRLTGQMVFADNADVYAVEGSILDFDVSGLAGETTSRVNNLSLVRGTCNYTLTVSDSQEKGIYLLAGGAAEFDHTITVQNNLGESFGTFSVGGVVASGENSFRLNLEGDALKLTVQARDNVAPTLSFIRASTTDPTDRPIVITAEFTDNNDELKAVQYKFGEDGEWSDFTGSITIYHNTTIFLKAIDLDQNESEIAEYSVSNIGDLTGLVLSAGQCVSVIDGESFSGTEVASDGCLDVLVGGIAKDTAIDSGGRLQIAAGGAAHNTTVHSGGILFVSAGGTATDLNVESGASLYIQVSPDTYVTGTSGGTGFMMKDGLVSDYEVDSGSLYVCSGARANRTTVNSGGGLHVSSGGTAVDITAEYGADLSFDVAPDTYIAGTSDSSAFEIKDGKISGKTVNAGDLYVLSGGTVSDITIYYEKINVASGGIVSGILMSGGSIYVSSGGSADAIAFNRGTLKVASGGTATHIALNPFESRLLVQAEDGAYVTCRNSGVYIGSGQRIISHSMIMSSICATYNSRYVWGDYAWCGAIYVMSGGKTVDTLVHSRGSMYVSSGGTAIHTEVYSGSMFVSSGGTAIGGMIEVGRLNVYSGGVISNIIVDYNGRLNIIGGTANSVTINGSASGAVSSGGTVNGLIVNSGGRITVYGGKLTGRVICNSGGYLTVNGGTIVDFDLTQVLPGAVARFDRIFYGGTFTITVDADQREGIYALAEKAGDFNNSIAIVNTFDELLGTISVGETITISDTSYTLFLSDSTLSLKIGDDFAPPPYTSNGLVVDGSAISVKSGEAFFDTLVNPGGTLVVASGGTALETRENGGYVDVRPGANITFAPTLFYGRVLDNASTTVHSGTTAVSTTVLAGGDLRVFSGGTATKIVWTPCEGRIDADEGASVTFVSQYSGVYYGSGDHLLSNAATMDFISLDSAREMYVMSGGNVFSTTVGSGGRLTVSSGGTAEEIVWTPCEGHVSIGDGAAATFASRYSGVYFGSDDHLLSHAATMESVMLDSGCEMYIMSEAIAHSTTIGDGGRLYVSSGGLANSVTIQDGGSMHVSSGAYAVSPIVSSGGSLYISSGGTAAGIILHDLLHVSSAGMIAATVISAGGRMIAEDGAINYTFITAGGAMTLGNGTATSTFVSSGGSFCVLAGGTATDITISSGAYLGFAVDSDSYIAGCSTTIIPASYSSAEMILESRFEIKGGVVSAYKIESGYLDVHSGGTVCDITIDSAGSLLISSGGMLTGRLWNSGGIVSAFEGAIVNFDLNQMFPWAAARINKLSNIQGNPNYTITVSAEPAAGVYTLAGNAFGFHKSITVVDTSGTELGSLSVGKTITISDTSYSLNLKNGVLSLQVGVVDSPVSAGTSGAYDPIHQLSVGSGKIFNDVLVEASNPGTNGLSVFSGGIVNDTILRSQGIMKVASGGTANNTVVTSRGLMYISNGGVVNRTAVNGNMFVYGGGEANNTTIGSGGNLYVNGTNIESRNLVQSLGASVNNTIVDSDGNLFVRFGGKANGATIKSGGILWVSSGGTATDVTVSSGGHLEIILAPETSVTGTFGEKTFEIVDGRTSDDAFESTYFYVMRDGIIENASLKDGSIRVLNGGTANSTTIGQGCSMYVSMGGTATNIIENGGFVRIDSRYGSKSVSVSFASHTFSDLALSNGASATVHSGTTANSVTVDSGCRLIVCGGKALNIIENGGYVEGEATFASNTVSGLELSSGASATVHSGTTINGLTVSGQAYLDAFSGGKLTGQITFESGARLNFEDGVVFDFDISCLLPDETARVNNLSRISGDALYTLTVSDRQVSGTYVLAEGAYDFEGTIEVQDPSGQSIGTITVDTPLETEEYIFTLSLTDSALSLNVDGPDWIAPMVSDIQVSTKALTNQDVIVSADFFDNTELARSLFKIGETGEWSNYVDGVVVTENDTVFFKAVDTAGNESEIAGYKVRNIDKEPPVIELTGDNTSPLQTSTLTARTEVELDIFYSTDLVTWTKYEGEVSVAKNGTYYFKAADAVGNTGTAEYSFSNIRSISASGVVLQTQTWEAIEETMQYIVEFSTDNFEHVVRLAVGSNSIDAFQMPTGNYQWRVRTEGGEDWSNMNDFVSGAEADTPKVIQSNEDGKDDLFFASTSGTWENIYFARHVGSINDWNGTNEFVSAGGKGRIQNLFFGSSDPNVLCLTDGENGDALFVDDVYTGLPESIAEHTARLYNIGEIRAGAGDDIVDMTSRRFEYTGDGLTIRGGDGDDVIWANKGANRLFGDAGNDRIAGASGDDVIVGGIGNDSMHGGGGNDVFAFCSNWGEDTVEQLADGTVTLWFASGNESNWDASSLTYTDGENSVKVSGVAADRITLIFGDDGSGRFAALADAGAFDAFTSQRIFEESGKGILASQ